MSRIELLDFSAFYQEFASPEPCQRIVTVNKAWADRALATRIFTRPVSRSWVERYKRDFRDGKWNYTGDTIKFHARGLLVDGQHRLTSVSETDTSARFLVVYGLTDAAVHKIDLSRPRLTQASLGMLGIPDAKRRLAILRAIFAFIPGESVEYNLSPDDALSGLKRYPGIDWMVSMPRLRGQLGWAQVEAAFVVAWQQAPDETAALYERFSTGHDLSRGDPLLAVRNYLTVTIANDVGSTGASVRAHLSRRVLTAIAYSMLGKELAKSQDSTSGLKYFQRAINIACSNRDAA